jgi:hypothetical protein
MDAQVEPASFASRSVVGKPAQAGVAFPSAFGVGSITDAPLPPADPPTWRLGFTSGPARPGPLFHQSLIRMRVGLTPIDSLQKQAVGMDESPAGAGPTGPPVACQRGRQAFKPGRRFISKQRYLMYIGFRWKVRKDPIYEQD